MSFTVIPHLKSEHRAGCGGGTPLIPALGRQRRADFWVQGQPGLHSEFQDSQGYTEKPCLKKPHTHTHTHKGKQLKLTQPESWTKYCIGGSFISWNITLLKGISILLRHYSTYAEVEGSSQWRPHILYDSVYIKSSGQANLCWLIT